MVKDNDNDNPLSPPLEKGETNTPAFSKGRLGGITGRPRVTVTDTLLSTRPEPFGSPFALSLSKGEREFRAGLSWDDFGDLCKGILGFEFHEPRDTNHEPRQ